MSDEHRIDILVRASSCFISLQCVALPRCCCSNEHIMQQVEVASLRRIHSTDRRFSTVRSLIYPAQAYCMPTNPERQV